ncbi:MAG: molybdate transporter family protein [Anaerolineae bacterium]
MTGQAVAVRTSEKKSLHAKSLRFTLTELGGALGDVGTLVPLAVTLIVINKMNPAAVFLIVGLLYVGAGLYYGVPTPVQPLKAVSAIAISLGLAPGVISASGLLMGALLMFLSLTGLMDRIAKLFSKPVIRGIQLSVGLLLIKSGVGLILKPQLVINGPNAMLDIVHARVPLSLLAAVGAMVVLAYFLTSRRFPASLAVLAYGVGVSLFFDLPIGLGNIEFSVALPQIYLPTARELSTAFILLVIPQVPLTLGNAVVATSDAARLYFDKRASKVTYKALSISMGLANTAAGLLGGMPVCHGSGGLTAHYRFGARTGGANLMIGAICLTLAVFFSKTILLILSLIPYPILGVLLAFVGIQHSLLIRDIGAKGDFLVVASIAVVSMLTSNLAIGFGLGLVIYHSLILLKAHKVN